MRIIFATTFLIIVSYTFFCGCAKPNQSGTVSTLGPKMESELIISPSTFSLKSVSDVKFGINILNTSENPIDTEAHLFALSVNGKPDFGFSMRMGNGIRSNEWFNLAPKGTLYQDLSDISPQILNAVGTYKLKLSWNQTEVSEILVTVTE